MQVTWVINLAVDWCYFLSDLPSHRASSPFDQYQIIVLVDVCVWSTCLELLQWQWHGRELNTPPLDCYSITRTITCYITSIYVDGSVTITDAVWMKDDAWGRQWTSWCGQPAAAAACLVSSSRVLYQLISTSRAVFNSSPVEQAGPLGRPNVRQVSCCGTTLILIQ